MTPPGVMLHDGNILCYEIAAGGIRARVLGERELLAVTPALAAAIQQDVERQRAKSETLRETADS